MAIQKLIDNAVTIDINRQADMTTTRTRQGFIKYAKGLVNPYRFSVRTHDGISYANNRDLPAQIDQMDRVFAEKISLNNSTGMNYMTAYKGDATASDIGNIVINSSSGANLYIDTSGFTSANASLNLFEKGDYIQPEGTVVTPLATSNSIRHSTFGSPTVNGVGITLGEWTNTIAKKLIDDRISANLTVKVIFPPAGEITSADGWDTALGGNVYYLGHAIPTSNLYAMYTDEALTTRYNPSTPASGSNYVVTANVSIPLANTYQYPYTVVEDVTYEANSNLTVKCHRGILSQTDYEQEGVTKEISVENSQLKVGNDVTFLMKFIRKPKYSIVPSRNILIDDFDLVENLNKRIDGR